MSWELSEVFRTFNVAEADFISSRLSGAGLSPSIRNDQSSLALGSAAMVGGIRIYVPSGEYEDAVRVLSEKG